MLARNVVLLKNESILGLGEKICATVNPEFFWSSLVGSMIFLLVSFQILINIKTFIYFWLKTM